MQTERGGVQAAVCEGGSEGLGCADVGKLNRRKGHNKTDASVHSHSHLHNASITFLTRLNTSQNLTSLSVLVMSSSPLVWLLSGLVAGRGRQGGVVSSFVTGVDR